MQGANIDVQNHVVGASPEVLAKLERKLEELDFAQAYQWQAGDRVRFDDVDLRGVIFVDVCFTGSDFSGCDLSKTIFCDCAFWGCDFEGVKFLPDVGDVGTRFVGGLGIPSGTYNAIKDFCEIFNESFNDRNGFHYAYYEVVKPYRRDGELIGYKALVNGSVLLVAKLLIPADAQRLLYRDSKCRAERAFVEEITEVSSGRHCNAGCSPMSSFRSIVYEVGKWVMPDSFDKTAMQCSHGIHFFLTEGEAVEYGRQF